MSNNEIDVEDEVKKTSRVIYWWSVPAMGHLNATFCVINELIGRLDEIGLDRVVFYCGESFREHVLNLPNNSKKNCIEFRTYGLQESVGSDDWLKLILNFSTRPGARFRVGKVYDNSIRLGAKHIFEKLVVDMNADRPELVVYDQALFFPKLALDYYAKLYKCEKPLNCCYVTSFMCANGIYPKWSELQKMGLLGDNSNFQSEFKNVGKTMFDIGKYSLNYYKTLLWDLEFRYDIKKMFQCLI